MAKRDLPRRMGAAVSALTANATGAPATSLGQAMYGLSSDAPRIAFLPTASVQPNPEQPRRQFDEESLLELAESIDRLGLLQPILVRSLGGGLPGDPPQWMIVAGERRWRAVSLLQQPTIAAIVTGRDPAEAALVENLQRKDLHPVDLARALSRLAEQHGYRQEDLATIVSKSQGEISKLFRLLSLPPEVLDAAAANEGVTRATLYRIACAPVSEQQALWAQEAARLNGGGGDVAPSLPEVEPVELPLASEDKPPQDPAQRTSKAIASFHRRLLKIDPAALDDDQKHDLRLLREAISSLLGEETIPPE